MEGYGRVQRLFVGQIQATLAHIFIGSLRPMEAEYGISDFLWAKALYVPGIVLKAALWTFARGLLVLDPEDGSMLACFDRNCGYHGNVFVNGDELIGVDMDETVHAFRLPPVGK